MKYAIVLLLLAASTFATAATYYVSREGDDSADGLTESTAWRTISKVNSSFAIIKPGDKILFRSGDTFYGTIKITKSGAAGFPIIIGAYGTGGKPVVSGFKNPSVWTNTGGGIYSTPVTCESPPEMVTINGIQYAMGRWPNSEVWPVTQTWASIDSFTGVTSITDAELGTTGINWTGAELAVRNSTRNRISRYPITSHTGNTLLFSGGNTSYPVAAGWGYFIQNDKRTLDKFGEWYYDAAKSVFYMYFGSENPANHFVNVGSLNNLISFGRGITYCNIINVSLNGANLQAINGLGYNHNSMIDNCDITLCGYNGISFWGSQNLKINNCIIDHCNDNAIYIIDNCENTYIGNNDLTNIGLLPGMGQGAWASGKTIYLRGSDNAIIEYNTIKRSGFSGIQYSGNNITIKNNVIDTYGIIKEDCGGIQYSGGATYSNLKVLNNIVINGLGSPGGKPANSYPWVAGIYLDTYTTGGVEISNNTVAKVYLMGGILISNSQNVTVKNNTVYECSSCIRMQELGGTLTSPIRNITMTGNVLFAKTPSFKPILLYSLNNDFNQFGSFDYNYYARPVDNAKPIYTGISGTLNIRSLAEWQTLYSLDLHSAISPVTLTDTADIDFYYNPTKSDKIFPLAKPMTDVKGTKYVSSITLPPFTSAVLMVDPKPDPTGTAPVYLSSIIPTYPTIMVMNYNTSLANITPSPSAFTVMANSVQKPVKTVMISGNTVRLYLTEGVAAGDIVTVSYTRPSTNPLQSLSGGLAASISNQPVTNNITGNPPVYISSIIPTYPTIMVMNYSTSLADITPATTAFTVMANSVQKTVKSVAIYGTAVWLYLAEGVRPGDVVTVSYTRPSTNPLQSLSGGLAASISNQPVTNNITGVPPVYISSVIPKYPTIMVMTYDITLADITPSPAAFTVMANSVQKTVKSVAIYGTAVWVYLEEGVRPGDIVTVSYTRPSTNPLQSTSGGLAASISNQPVTNNITGVPPVYINSSIPKYPTIMVMNYDITLADIIPATTAFTIRANSVQKAVKSVAIYGTAVWVYLAEGVNPGDIVTVSYTRPSTNPLQSLSGGLAASISNQPVINSLAGDSKSDTPVLTDLFKTDPDAIKGYDTAEEELNIYSGSDKITVFPNPAREIINISFNEPATEDQVLKIYDLSGKSFFISKPDPGIRTIQIPVNFNPGIYYLKLLTGNRTVCIKKVIVVN